MFVAVMMAIILAGTASATFAAVRHQDRAKASRVERTRDAIFEDRMRDLIGRAFLATNTTDTSSYFVGGQLSGSENASNLPDDSLTFTTLGERIPAEYCESTDDFETLNERFGPVGGMVEVSLTLTPVGNAPVQEGLFLRRQIPSDGDNSQGGFESLLDPDIRQISFEFFDGTDWQLSWDTVASNQPRLPAAVRITYQRENDTNDRIFVVRCLHSDVTPDNPTETPGGGSTAQ